MKENVHQLLDSTLGIYTEAYTCLNTGDHTYENTRVQKKKKKTDSFLWDCSQRLGIQHRVGELSV